MPRGRARGGDTTRTYTWGYNNELTQITYGGGGTNTFTYDGIGRRVTKVDSTGSYSFVYDGNRIISDGQAVYTRAGSARLISERRGNDSRWHHSDDLTSTRTLTNSSQTTTDTFRYDVWGDIAERTGTTPTPHQFVGALGYEREADSGLLRLGFRYYDPSLGRFLSQDPIGDGDNWYIYAGNDPVNYVDLLGLARVEVRFKQLGGIGPSHAYIIVSENDGSNPYFIRFGPASNAGLSGQSSSSGGSSSQSSGSRPYLFGGSSNNSSHSSNSSSPGISRGGPGKNAGPFGPIVESWGPYREGTPDYTTAPVPSITIIAGDNKPASYYEKQFRQIALDIGVAQIPYNPLTTNSNAAASEVLARAGLGTKMTKTPVWAPGWSTDLPKK